MDHDDFFSYPANISTVVDLLDTKAISWGSYQEDMPYPGFAGFNFSNQKTFANDYVRKHNPLQLFASVSNNATKAAQIKTLVNLTSDVDNKKLPQWSFITPNMKNDGHDTNITFAGAWTRAFLEPLVANDYVMQKTLIAVSFDENEDYPTPNRVFTVLLGGAIDSSLHGTTDDTFYNHYSMLATVEANWDLPSLGRWDCDANILALVANKTGYKNPAVSTDGLYFNASYPGAASDKKFTPGWWATPNTQLKCSAGHGVLPAVISTWGNSTGSYNYTNVYPYDAVAGIATGGKLVNGSNDNGSATSSSGGSDSGSGTGTGSSGSSTTSAAPSATSSKSAAAPLRAEALFHAGVIGLVAAAIL